MKRSRGASVVVVGDFEGNVMGGFVSEPWKGSKGAYFGNGESFVMQVHPTFKVFPSSQANRMFAIGASNFLAFGGGGDGFALRLDSTLEFGSSERSATYNNDALASSSPFRVVCVEVWAID